MSGRFRVVVATDRIGELPSAIAGAGLAAGFSPVAQVAVVPVAASGPDLAAALAALFGGQVQQAGERWRAHAQDWLLVGLRQPTGPAWVPGASTTDFGEWVVECLAADPEAATVYLDLTGLTAHDGGSGLLAVAGDRLRGRRLVGVVDGAELELAATGIGGGLARRAFEGGIDVAELLRADAALAAWAEELQPGLATAAGGGAAGTAALAVLALGGTLTSGPQLCADQARLAQTVRAADLVVTGCTRLTALDRGGPVVRAVADLAEAAERPCILFGSGEPLSRRELRTLGLESAHAVPFSPTEADLSAAAARIAVGWLPSASAPNVS